MLWFIFLIIILFVVIIVTTALLDDMTDWYVSEYITKWLKKHFPIDNGKKK